MWDVCNCSSIAEQYNVFRGYMLEEKVANSKTI